MYPTTYLEWFHEGEWRRIGWPASNPQSTTALRDHGRALAVHGGRYRLVRPSIYSGRPATVVHEFPRVAA